MRQFLLGVTLACAATVITATTANAHATLETKQARVGATYKGVVRVPHGCDGAPTTKVRVVIPEGVIAAKPMPKPGWTLEIVRGPYAKSYKYYHGKELSEGPKELIWTGQLLDDHYDEFVFTGLVTDGLSPGTTLYFPIHQECDGKLVSWSEIPAAGQDARSLKTPAPAVALVAAPAPAASVYKIGSLVIEMPWARATPGGARVAGGYLKITNNGQQPDRLVGGSFAAAAEVEIHDMSTVDGMMKMRRLADGLEIKPGETVELKPGAHHVMFMGLKAPFAEGQPVSGSLKFEKAGSVDVTFQVAPVGARSAGGSGHH